ncbi:MAG: hypothetical protein Q6373_021575, partial [Candidatus Sigynarchaeota archaeon]
MAIGVLLDQNGNFKCDVDRYAASDAAGAAGDEFFPTYWNCDALGFGDIAAPVPKFSKLDLTQHAYDRAWQDFMASCDEIFIVQQVVDTAVGILIIVASSTISGAISGAWAGPWGALAGAAVGFVVSTVLYYAWGEASEAIFGTLRAYKDGNKEKASTRLRDLDAAAVGSWDPYEKVLGHAWGSAGRIDASTAPDYYSVDFMLPTFTRHAPYVSATDVWYVFSDPHDGLDESMSHVLEQYFGSDAAAKRFRHGIYDRWAGGAGGGAVLSEFAIQPRVRYEGWPPGVINKGKMQATATDWVWLAGSNEVSVGAPVDVTNASVVYAARAGGNVTVVLAWTITIQQRFWDKDHSRANYVYWLEFNNLWGGLPGVSYEVQRRTAAGQRTFTLAATFTIEPWSPVEIDTGLIKPFANGTAGTGGGYRAVLVRAPVSELAAVEKAIARGTRQRLSTLVPTVGQDGMVGWAIAPAGATTPNFRFTAERPRASDVRGADGSITTPWYDRVDEAPQYQAGYEIVALASRYQEAYARASRDSPIAWQWTVFNYAVQAVQVVITVIATHG